MFEDPRTRGPRPPFAEPGSSGNLDPKPDYGERTYTGRARLRGCGAIVLGGDSGIGRAVAIAFAREGSDVLIAFQTEEKDAEETAEWVRKAGGRAVLAGGHFDSERRQTALVEQAIGEFGHLDVLVNDAVAGWAHLPADGLSAAQIEESLRQSTEGAFAMAKAAAPRMKPGGSIITTTAVRSSHPVSQQRAHAAFQGGVASLTASLATEFAPLGIRANAVEPGPVWAPRFLRTLTPEQRRNLGADTMLGRPAQPAELAPAYVFLASSEASYMTGAVLSVTGGRFESHSVNLS
jgi:NAD(P)-dependent dehydrogenase (short-subunit alcohol dehydrogenase family)